MLIVCENAGFQNESRAPAGLGLDADVPQIDKVAQPPFNWALAWTGGCHNVVDVANTFSNKTNSIPIYTLPLNYELIEIKQFLLIKMSDFTFHCASYSTYQIRTLPHHTIMKERGRDFSNPFRLLKNLIVIFGRLL